MFFFSFYQREDIKQENDESGHLRHRRRFVTAVLPWRCWWVVCTAVKTRQTHLKISPSQLEFCVYILHYSRLTVCCHPGLTWVTCRSGGSCTPTGSRCSWSSRACSPSWWSLMHSCSPWFFCLWGKREIHPLLMSAFELVWLNLWRTLNIDLTWQAGCPWARSCWWFPLPASPCSSCGRLWPPPVARCSWWWRLSTNTVYNAVTRNTLQDCSLSPTYFRFVQQTHEEAKGPEVSSHILRFALHILLIEYVDQSLR